MLRLGITLTVTLMALALGGCTVFGPGRDEQQILVLLGQLNLCQYDQAERKRMYDAARMGNKTPYPLLYCEGERSARFDARFLDSRKHTGFEVLGSHFEADGYGAALIKIRTPAWRRECEALGQWDSQQCEAMVMGINAPQLKKVDKFERLRIWHRQDQLAQVGKPEMMVDYFLMPLKRDSGGQLRPNWVENGGAARASLGLAERVGEAVEPLPVQYYDKQYDLLAQDALPQHYMGVFFYATPQLLDYVARPEPAYSFPLRKGVSSPGYRVSIYRAVKGKREF
ncbi:hypothetical protein [Ferrimonas kyonanensis]|uniref:hypothetical protein n=1 Tax=Ferrimonas kyonanensis TaxID=364763 RepID=UPI0003FFA7B5|nr:hypothetical protein [Ferrimonas kyonanensis]